MTPSHGLASDSGRLAVHHLRLSTKAKTTYQREQRLPLRDRIPQMSYDEMLALCERNGLRFKRTAQNQGILVMRARNALYWALRENKPLQED